MTHTITITVESDRSHEELVATLTDLVNDAAGGYVGDPGTEPLYGATLVGIQ